MKKTVVLALLALLGTISTYAQVSFGVKAGFSSAKMSFEESDGVKRLAAWHAGGIADIELAENFALQPQLLVSTKGYKAEGVEGFTEDESFRLTYLELPVNFLYKHELGAGKIFGGFGPYLALGLSGKYGDTDVKFDGKKTEELEETDEDIHAKALDAGANFIVGYELKNGLLFSVNYSLGLTDVDPGGTKSKNGYFGISVGYLFRKK